MTLNDTFNQYYKRKLLIWGSVGIVAILIRIVRGYETSFAFASTLILCFLAAALIVGYIDYNFYEKSAPKIISYLIDKAPLVDFQEHGFSKQEDNKLEGYINNYKITLSPVTNLEGDKWLVVLIPLKIREGLDGYFTKYNDAFKFRLSDQVLFAEAVLKNYEKEYDFRKLLNLIDVTTLSLRKDQIDPLEIIDE